MKTKKLFLAIGLFLTAFSAVVAQDLNLGLKAGGNYSTLSGMTGSETEYLPGFHIGLTAEFKLAPMISLQPELFYSLEGVQAKYNYSIGEAFFSSEQKVKLGYVNLPLILKYSVVPSFSLQAGPQIGYLVNAKNKYEVKSSFPGEMEVHESGEEDIKGNLKKISLGLNFGLGYEFKNNLFLQARYHVGLSDVSDYDEEMGEDFDGELDKVKNSGFQASLGYKF